MVTGGAAPGRAPGSRIDGVLRPAPFRARTRVWARRRWVDGRGPRPRDAVADAWRRAGAL